MRGFIEHVAVLQAGETPWEYRQNPGELPGPWGETAGETIALLKQQAGLVVAEHWEREIGGVRSLWVIAEDA